MRRSATRLGLAYRAFRYRTRVDPDGIRWVRSVLRAGDVAVDVGAYKGGYTYWMRRAVGATGSVLAFEPQPELVAYLRRCVRDFGWSNVDVVASALGSSRGRRVLLRPGTLPSPAASLLGASLPPGALGQEVDVTTLDDQLAARPSAGAVRLLKCDVEGAEMDVLHGARQTLARHRPFVVVECEVRHDPGRRVEDVFAHLVASGYGGFFHFGGDRLDVSRFQAPLHQVEGRRPYVNNFFFEPLGS